MVKHDPNQVRMSLGDHLEELRKRIMIGLLGPLVGAIIALIFGKTLLTLILTPYVEAQRAAGFSTAAEALNITETFAAYLKVSLLGGLIVGLPWLAWQLWRFIAAGLYAKERRFVMWLVPGSAALTISGLMFMYFIMLPVMLSFFIRFAASMPAPVQGDSEWFAWFYHKLELPKLQQPIEQTPDADQPKVIVDLEVLPQLPMLDQDPTEPDEGAMWIVGSTVKLHAGGRTLTFLPDVAGPIAQRQRLTEWISLVTRLAIAFALTFQTPLVLVLLDRIGLASVHRLRAVRKYALLGAVVMGAIFTPADPISQVLLAVPMYALYELGLLLCHLLNRRREQVAT